MLRSEASLVRLQVVLVLVFLPVLLTNAIRSFWYGFSFFGGLDIFNFELSLKRLGQLDLLLLRLLLLLLNLFKFKTLQGFFDDADIALGRVEELGAALACNVEAVDFWLVMVDLGRQNYGHGVVLQEHVGEARAECSSVDVHLPGFGNVDFLASWAVVLEPRHLEAVAETDWKDFLTVTQRSRTGAVDAAQELLVNLGKTTRRQNESGVQH